MAGLGIGEQLRFLKNQLSKNQVDMNRGDQEKAGLFTSWLYAHLKGNLILLFSTGAPSFELTAEAKSFFAKPEVSSLYLYILLVRNGDELIPLYIGKASSPRSRWINGHLRSLRKALSAERPTGYSRWVRALEKAEGEVYLFCIHEGAICYPPIPDFPKTVGSIEYQLVSLASDAFPGMLLNNEGVGR
jgi:hypothetical protein